MKDQPPAVHVVIIGAGGHGSELASYITDLTGFGKLIQLVGFVDDFKREKQWAGVELIGTLDDFAKHLRRNPDQQFLYISAFGDNGLRKQVIARIDTMRLENLAPWILAHPSAVVASNAEIGPGSCLAPGAIMTANAKMGLHCIVNVNASVSHDAQIGDFCNINPGAVICGDVFLGEGCYVGANSTVIEKIRVGEWSIIGAGAVVIEDVPPHVTVAGVPAKIIKRHNI